MPSKFRIAITRDVLTADGELFFPDLGLELLDAHEHVDWEILPDATDELTPEHTASYDGILLLAPRVTGRSFGANPRTSVISRFGVGYDNVDVDACTRAGAALTITPDAVRRPVASAMMAMVLALAHRVRERDLLVRNGLWSSRFGIVGTGLTGRTIGVVGLGRIGMEFSKLMAPMDVNMVAFDPYADSATAREHGVNLVGLDDLLSTSDFVCVSVPLTEDTHKLIDGSELAKMKDTAYLVNVARGPVVDEVALTEALAHRRIAGAALDVFDPEPPHPDNPLLVLDNVILTPHSIAHTTELYRDCGRSAIRNILAVADGDLPVHVVNPDVLRSDSFVTRVKTRRD